MSFLFALAFFPNLSYLSLELFSILIESIERSQTYLSHSKPEVFHILSPIATKHLKRAEKNC